MPKRRNMRVNERSLEPRIKKKKTTSETTTIIPNIVLEKQYVKKDNINAKHKHVCDDLNLSSVLENNNDKLNNTIEKETVECTTVVSDVKAGGKRPKMYKKWSKIKKTLGRKTKTKVVLSSEIEKEVPIVVSNWDTVRQKIEGPLKGKMKVEKPQKQTPEKQSTDVAVKVQSQPREIWFDDVDEELLKEESSISVDAPPTQKNTSRFSDSPTKLVKPNSYDGLTKAVALDCEMVGVGSDGRESVLARVSVVNQFGQCLYDTFVKCREQVCDYRTQFSGVTEELLKDASHFLDVQKRVSDLIKGRILVGHSIRNDLKVLFLDHPRGDIRDTSRYKPYKDMFKGRTPSLKNLTSRLLNVKIQTGEHNSVIDAQATMQLYMLNREVWEKKRTEKRSSKSAPKAEEKEAVASNVLD